MNIRTAKWTWVSSRNIRDELRIGHIVKCVLQISEYDRVGDTGTIVGFADNCVEIAWDNPTNPALARYLNRTPYANSYFSANIAYAVFEIKSEWESEFEFA